MIIPARMLLLLSLVLPFLPSCFASASDLDLPPRGWNSYDGFATAFDEGLLKKQAAALSAYSQRGGQFEYLVIDEGWAGDDSGAWFLDSYGRPTYNPLRYPSGMKSLADWLMEEHQLKLGLWIIRGITQKAVDLMLPIFGTNYTAADIAIKHAACPWHTDMLGINMTHPGGQLYYDSLVKLYSSWGIKYLKADCMFGTRDMLNPSEITGLSTALRLDTSIRLSLSPGVNASVSLARPYSQQVHSYRISDDLWDCWSTTLPCLCGDGMSVEIVHEMMKEFAPLVGSAGLHGGGSYPDPDMIPLGVLRLGAPTPGFRVSELNTQRQAEFVYVLWSIYASTFILGGDLTLSATYQPWLDSLYTNSMLVEMHQKGVQPHPIVFSKDMMLWSSNDRTDPLTLYAAAFVFSQDNKATGSSTFEFTFDMFGISSESVSSVSVYDALAQTKVGEWRVGTSWKQEVDVNHVAALKLVLHPASSSIVLEM